jgi:hypothetical protein
MVSCVLEFEGADPEVRIADIVREKEDLCRSRGGKKARQYQNNSEAVKNSRASVGSRVKRARTRVLPTGLAVGFRGGVDRLEPDWGAQPGHLRISSGSQKGWPSGWVRGEVRSRSEGGLDQRTWSPVYAGLSTRVVPGRRFQRMAEPLEASCSARLEHSEIRLPTPARSGRNRCIIAALLRMGCFSGPVGAELAWFGSEWRQFSAA